MNEGHTMSDELDAMPKSQTWTSVTGDVPTPERRVADLLRENAALLERAETAERQRADARNRFRTIMAFLDHTAAFPEIEQVCVDALAALPSEKTRPPRRGYRTEPAPPEVALDYHHNQILALQENGERFPRYIDCSVCGWLIGCGDAIDAITHESCAALPSEETPNAPERPRE